MSRLRNQVPFAALAALLSVLSASGLAQQAAPAPSTPRPITLEDYPKFRRIGAAAISNDGKWMHYTITPNEGDGTLYVKALDAETVHEIARGANPSFSNDGRWLAYFVAPPSTGRGGRGGRGGGGRGTAPVGNQSEQAPPRAFWLMDLTNASRTTYAGVNSVSFSPKGDWLAMRPQGGAPAAGEGDGGRGGRGGRGGAGAATPQDMSQPAADLVMRHLASGRQQVLGNVGSFVFDDAGTMMAYTVRGAQRLGNGAYLMALADGSVRTLDAAAADYDQLAWNTSGKGAHVAVLRGTKADGKEQKDNVLLAWNNVGASGQSGATLDPAKSASFPKGMVISEFATLRWNDTGTRILFGVKEQASTPEESSEPRANVDVWHWRDTAPQSVQIVRLNQDRRATLAAVFDVASGAARQIADETMRAITPTDDLTWAVGRNDEAYRGEIAWGGSRADVYRVNLATGERALIERGLSRTMGFSPDGKWFLYLKGGQVFSYETASGRKTRIDGGRSFVDVEDDHDYEKPVYGTGGFTADGRSAIFYDKFDVWTLPLAGGTPVNLTKGEGAKQEIQFRVTTFLRGPDDDPGIDLTKPLVLSANGLYTKKDGYFELAPGGAPRPLVWVDKSIGNPLVAERADRMIYTQQTFNEYPNYWLSDKRFGSPRQVTNAHPDIFKEFAWGSKKLIDYTNSKGQRLQATMTLPANYQAGRRYPMLVYFYEIMSNTHHNFNIPPYDDRPHMATYASNGYIVLQPDVVYEIGKPGSSALDCVGSAVRKVIELGYADPKRVGLQGHSWGGYQSSFIVTQTDMFAAVVTGAPPTNLVSFYGTLYRSSGNIQQGITEAGQVRMGKEVTPWNAHALYESQSPIHHTPNIKTPFLILHGTADGAVDWGQGLEFYAAARRLGKQVILLSYPDEAHHLGRRENQKDFQVRMRQFFDHYLKGEPAPQWMTEGVPQVQKGSR